MAQILLKFQSDTTCDFIRQFQEITLTLQKQLRLGSKKKQAYDQSDKLDSKKFALIAYSSEIS